MAKLEGRLPQSKWSLSAHNVPSFGYFHKIFGMHLQKGLAYLFFLSNYSDIMLLFVLRRFSADEIFPDVALDVISRN